MINLAIFVSGKGGFCRFLLENMEMLPNVRIATIISDKKEPILAQIAAKFNLPLSHIDYKKRTREEVDREILDVLQSKKVDLALLNYNKLLGPTVIDFLHEIYNLHLSLLPLHKGFGAIEAAYHENMLFYGASIHHTDKSTDGGKMLAQVVIPKTQDVSLEDMIQNIFRYGCLLQLSAISHLTNRKSATTSLYHTGYFNPPLQIDPEKAEDNYHRGIGKLF